MHVSVYQSASALNSLERWQEVIAENIASASVPGFKKKEFSFAASPASEPLAGRPAGPLAASNLLPVGRESSNFLPGPFHVTGVQTDVGIDGSAFFAVQLPDGATGYSRDGEFRLDPQGQLLTKNGWPVLGDAGPLQLDPNNHGPLSISATGEVSQGADRKGRLKLVEFAQPQQLTRRGGDLFLDGGAAGAADATASSVRQGVLEAANTSTTTDMAQLLTAMKLFEANHKVMQSQDERMGRSISELVPV